MPRQVPQVFLTFVLMLPLASLPFDAAVAATNSPSPDFKDSTPTDSHVDPEPMRVNTIDITDPPPSKIARSAVSSEYFYKYRHAITIRAGSLYNTNPREGENSQFVAGAQYMFPTKDLKSFEAGADLFSDGTGAAHFAQRFIYSRTRFRPYTKVGLGVLIVPKDQLATFIKYENYQVRGAGGFEYLFDILGTEINLRLEAEATLSTKTMQAAATLGYVWAW